MVSDDCQLKTEINLE